jgi:outer membrane protein assembly factor BamB
MRHKSSLYAFAILAALSILITSSTLGHPPSTNDWPKFHGNLRNTGVSYPTLHGITTPQQLWSYTTDNTISPSSPSLADLDNDGKLETVIGTANFANTGGVYAIETDGTLKWKYATGDYGTYACPAIEDIDGDGLLEVAFVSYAGKITVLENDGTEKWKLDKLSAGTKAAIADVDGDGDLEVIAGAASKIWLLNADGTEVWNKNFIVGTEPAFADVDGDGGLEIVFAALGTSTIVALNADGSTQWTSPATTQDFQISLSITNDLNSDGKPDIAVGCRDKNVYAYSGANGAKLWSYLTVGRVFGIAVADMNGDGTDDIVATATKGDGIESYAYVLKGQDGSLIWSHNIVGKIYYTTEGTPSIADINKDSVLDVVTGSTNSKVYALSGVDGSEVWAFNVAGSAPSAPALADIETNGFLNTVIANGNIVYCIGTRTYYLTVKTDPLGITTIPGEGWYIESGAVTLSAPQLMQNPFLYWDVDGVSQGSLVNPITVTMNAAHTATAHYYTAPVGGEWAPINAVQLLAPYVALALIALAALAAGSWRLIKKRW